RDPVQHQVAPERLSHAADRDHFRPNFFSRRPTRMISGTHITRYQTATSVKISVFLNVDDAISLPWKESSATVMIEVCDVSLSSMMQVLPYGGSAILNACGNTTRQRMSTRLIPSDWAASTCPGSTASIPARNTSAM